MVENILSQKTGVSYPLQHFFKLLQREQGKLLT